MLTRLRLMQLFISAVIISAVAPHVAAAQVPTPVSVLGHTPGDDFYLADYEDAVRYFHALRPPAPTA